MKKNVGRLLVFYSISEKMRKNECFWRNGEEELK
ncbi:hypothetical protein CN984_16730 [Bacillus cereus]|uniref:Uncharacterized protein n=1 Tax=Bacillus cereus TaxID=1396 RepID=A0A2A8UDR2_BACCE|nr:hypothetical protein CDB3_04220 [Bacillus sp. CDB3]PDY82431.1 hypothetical protein CON06_12950 [Bacillus cereus]PQZ58903.1 hypothetical protein CQZ94_06240 [Bacillus sp. MYb209]PFA18052.1 hypothetical protein CN382_01205 [Bacillus cereus]PFL23119.1 hypothetical protein COJ07_05965 [Bacillus cereus]